MSSQRLPAATAKALQGTEWRWLRTTVRSRLESDGGAVSVLLDVDALSIEECQVLQWLLDWPTIRTGIIRVRLDRLSRALADRVTAGCGLPETLEELGGELDDRRATRRQAAIARSTHLMDAWQDLLNVVRGVRQLGAEYSLLAATRPGTSLVVPIGTATLAKAWSVYEAAVRAASVWWPAHDRGQRLGAKELAALAFHDSKAWTAERQLAFANLVRMPFDKAVDDADTEIMMRGPLRWTIGHVVADASACDPWIALPARGVRTLGSRDCEARGILIIENKEPFKMVCQLPAVTERWLCVWGKGYVSNSLVRFLGMLELPMAAWCDADADGVEIVTDLAKRTGRVVHPVGMDVALWTAGPKRIQTPRQLVDSQKKARRLATQGLAALRGLAATIAPSGDGCEQESLCSQVLPILGCLLRDLERPALNTAFVQGQAQ